MTRRIGRRAFLRTSGCAAAAAVCGSGCGGQSASVAGPVPTTPAAPGYASVTDEVADLLTGVRVPSGRIVIPGRPPIEIRDGRYTLSASHQLEIGSTHRDVLIEASGSVSRRTSVVVDPAGLRVDLGYKRAPLDLVSDRGLFEEWLRSRNLSTLVRWDPRLYRGAIVYDRQLFRHDGQRPVLASVQYDADPSFVSSALRIAGTEIAAMTAGALRNGVVRASELAQSAWPTPPYPPAGWLVLFTLANYFERQTFSILGAGFADDFGVVSGSSVALPPGRATNPAEMRTKIREALGVFRDGSVPAEPASAGESFGTIQYHRKIGQRRADLMDVQD